MMAGAANGASSLGIIAVSLKDSITWVICCALEEKE
jgi:hypothetical protein